MEHEYVLDWQKSETEQPNKLNILGLFMLSNIDQRFFTDHHVPIINSSPHGNSEFKGQLIQDSEEVIAKLVNSKYNQTNYNSIHFLASDSLQIPLQYHALQTETNTPPKTGFDLIKSNEISILLLSTPSIKSGKYDSKNTIETLNLITELDFKGKIIGITHGWSEKQLEKEYSKKKIPIITLEETTAGYDQRCYRYRLERAIIDYFTKPSNSQNQPPKLANPEQYY